MFAAACGGVTHFALAPDEEEGGVMTIAWGQGAMNGKLIPFPYYLCSLIQSLIGELGLGPNEPKSATKPTRHQPLIGIDVFEYVFLPTPMIQILLTRIS
jgi:hypothetical protein